MLNILVNNIRFANPTSLIRALKTIHQYPIQVWGTDTAPIGHTSASVLVDNYLQAPSIDNWDLYYQFIRDLCQKQDIDLLIPGSDGDVQFLSKYQHDINTITVVPEEQVVRIFQNKLDATLAVQELGVNVPYIIQNLFEEQKVIFRKKVSSSSAGIYIVDLTQETYIKNMFNCDYFVQRYVEGEEYTVDVFSDRDGKPKLILPRKRMQVRNGMSVCTQLCNHKRLIQACEKISQNYHLPGVFNVQFIDDGENSYFIELNMRFAGSGICGIAASFNYFKQYIDHFVHGLPLESLEYYMSKVAWGSIISRYYDECIYQNDISSFKS